MSCTISVVIPCYNEQAVLSQLFTRLSSAAESWGLSHEIICVDDGSSDRTWEMLAQQSLENPAWRCVRFSRNFGHQAAVSAGLWHATGDAVLVIDADLQDPPEQLHRFIEKWQQGYEVVYGVRESRQDKKLKMFLAWGFYRVIARMVSFNIPHDAGDFCLMDQKVVFLMNSLPERYKYLRGLRAWIGFRQIGLPFERQARAAGEPQYTFKKSLKLAMDGIFSFSAVPLSVASHVGMWVSVLAAFGAFITLIQRLFSTQLSHWGLGTLPGYATIVMSILFLGGVQLVCIGILGEYIGRIYEEIKGRPNWIIWDSRNILKPSTIPLYKN